MKFVPTPLPGVVVVEPRVFSDARGMFMETWEAKKFAAAGIDANFVQDNHSESRRWVLRGLHYQIRNPQGKLVRVTQGEVFDVVVDLRRSSATFGQWTGEYLSAENRRQLWIPAGFAHGFLAMSENTQFAYKCTDYYDPSAERTVRWDDTKLAIEWPLPPGVAPVVSDKDRSGAALSDAECFP